MFASADVANDLFPLEGHLNTSLGAVDANGNVVEQSLGDAFGQLDAATGLKQNHLYTGEYWDQDSQLVYLRARCYDPRIGRFVSADPVQGRPRDPRSLNRYVYAHSDPVHGTDPTGQTVLIGLNSNAISTGAMSAASANIARITANNLAGKALERFVEGQLQRFVTQYGGQVWRQVYFKGPGGMRFADFVVQVGNRFVAIEVKTKIPLSGGPLVRFGNQLKTYIQGAPANSALTGTAAEVIVITEESVAAIEAAYLAIEAQVSGGTIAGILQGTISLVTVLRGVLF